MNKQLLQRGRLERRRCLRRRRLRGPDGEQPKDGRRCRRCRRRLCCCRQGQLGGGHFVGVLKNLVEL